MRQLFLFTSLFFILFSFKVNAEDVKKEKVYIKKVLFKPEDNEKMFSIVIGCKGTTCSKKRSILYNFCEYQKRNN